MTAPTAAASTYTAAPSAARATLDAYLAALNARADVARFLSDDASLTVVGGPSAAGRDATVQMIRGIHEVAFDSRLQIGNVMADGAHATAELVLVGTHTGEFAGVPASGRAVEVPYAAVYDFAADGRISAIRAYVPMHVLMPQITG